MTAGCTFVVDATGQRRGRIITKASRKRTHSLGITTKRVDGYQKVQNLEKGMTG